MIRSKTAAVLAITLTTLSATALVAGALSDTSESEKINRSRDGLAIHGYDPVAYFTESKAVKGSPDYTHVVEGTRYQFASAANRDAFAKNPDAYRPQYGGFCAYAVSRGYTADVDPEAWAIVDGKLYLNYSKSVQRRWQEDVPGNIKKGDANWPRLRDGGELD